MNVCIFNGSPRGLNSNSTHLISWIRKGVVSSTSLNLIKHLEENEDYLEDLKTCDTLLIVFPLYVDAMPGIVMKFFEILGENKETIKDKNVYYLVHSGFPEASHSYPIKEYLENLSKKLSLNHRDVVIYGGSEGIRFTSEKKGLKKKELFRQVGQSIESEYAISDKTRKKLETPIKLNRLSLIIFRAISRVININGYWDSTLKKNNAYENRFDQPYIKES